MRVPLASSSPKLTSAKGRLGIKSPASPSTSVSLGCGEGLSRFVSQTAAAASAPCRNRPSFSGPNRTGLVCIKEFVDKDLVNKEFVDNVFIIKELVDEEFINEELFNGVFMVYFDKRFGGGEFLDEESQFFGLLFVRGQVLRIHHGLPSGRVCLNVE